MMENIQHERVVHRVLEKQAERYDDRIFLFFKNQKKPNNAAKGALKGIKHSIERMMIFFFNFGMRFWVAR